MRIGVIGRCQVCGNQVSMLNRGSGTRIKKDLRFCSRVCYRKRTGSTEPPESRFWRQVNKAGPIHPVYGQCWVWLGELDKHGYSEIRVDSTRQKVHRYSWILHNGEIPGEQWVLHRCDNRACVNPNHLFLGDVLDNNADMVAKERQQRGERHYQAVLTDDLVRYARKRYRPKSRKNGCAAIARELGISRESLSAAIRGKTWKHITVEEKRCV